MSPLPLLRLDGISWTAAGHRIIDDITLDVPAGARHALLGHNGAGKTTLINIIGGQLRPSRGRVYLGERDITGWAPHRIARAGLARTWQHPALAQQLTVLQNLTVASPRRISAAEMMRLLADTGLHDVHASRVADLPYGLRRRAEVAVALASRPRLLIFDEPTAGLAPAEITDLISMLSKMDPSVTILFTDHHPRIVEALATDTTTLYQGRITARSPARPPDPARASRRACRADAASQPILSAHDLSVGYGGVPVLTGVDLQVRPGEIMAVTGPNGAGKTTLLSTMMGLQSMLHGTVSIGGSPADRLSAARRHQLGLSIVPQERRTFPGLTVAQQLAVPRRRPDATDLLGPPEQLFPALAARLQQRADTLSGGEQQMLAFARAVAGQPALLLLDEPFEGLAGDIAAILSDMIRRLADAGVGILLADHHLAHLATLADTVLDLATLDLAPRPTSTGT